MCIIIDNCVRGLCFGLPVHPDAQPVLNWLLNGNGRLIYGGKLLQELEGMTSARKLLGELKRAGRAIQIHDAEIEIVQIRLNETKACLSNDQHVIALAQVSGARLLFTTDKALQKDFRNSHLIASPRGRVYIRNEHKPLLKHTKSCRFASADRRNKNRKR